MHPKRYLIIIIILSIGYACATPISDQQSMSVPPETHDNPILAKAEKLFQIGSYVSALEAYQEFIDKYPRDPYVDAALFKIGMIYKFKGRYEDALSVFDKLGSQYPKSSFIGVAQCEVVEVFFLAKNYEAVIRQSIDLLKSTAPESQKSRVKRLLADALREMGASATAVPYYSMIYRETKGKEADAALEKLKETIGKLSVDEIQSILESGIDEFTRGYLIYQLAILKAADQNYDEAFHLLAQFTRNYPRHEYIRNAHKLNKELTQWFEFEPRTIGCLLPLSGSHEAYGNQALKGIEHALMRFSQQSSSPPFKLLVRDTASNPRRAEEAVKEMAELKVALILGPITTAESAAKVAQHYGIPIITMTQKEQITDIGSFVFRNFITPEMQIENLVSYVVDELGLKRFAILYPKENYGQTFMNLFWDEVVKRGGTVVGIEYYSTDQNDFEDPIRKLVGTYYKIPQDLKTGHSLPLHPASALSSKFASVFGLDSIFSPPVEEVLGIRKKNPVMLHPKYIIRTKQSSSGKDSQGLVDFDAIFIPDSPKKSGLIIPQLAFNDVSDVLLLGTNLWHSSTLIEMSQKHVQGALLVDVFFSQSQSPKVQEFVSDFERIYGTTPGIFEASGYDSASMVLKALDTFRSTLRTDLRDELLKIKNYEGVTGITSFRENGDAEKQLFLLQIKNFDFVEVKRRGVNQLLK